MTDVLKQGTKGAQVEHVQRLLHQMGFYGGVINGDFDWRTHVAVTKYQQAAGLHVDGEVGADTWASLNGAASPHVGLRDEAHVHDYVNAAYGVMHSSMAPQDRLDKLMAAVLQELSELGVPAPDYQFKADMTDDARFTNSAADDLWRIYVNPAPFNNAEHLSEQKLGEVADTVYHEARHCEMTFREARAQAGLGKDAATLSVDMKIPLRIATLAHANAIRQSTADGATDEALAGYDSFYGSGSAATDAVYKTGTYEQYRRLYEEADAFEAGREVQVDWRHHGGVRGTVEMGDESDDVSYLQRGLAHLGFFHDTATGHFGQVTHDAVVAFQTHYSLHKVDGVCGEETWEMLARVYAE